MLVPGIKFVDLICWLLSVHWEPENGRNNFVIYNLTISETMALKIVRCDKMLQFKLQSSYATFKQVKGRTETNSFHSFLVVLYKKSKMLSERQHAG